MLLSQKEISEVNTVTNALDSAANGNAYSELSIKKACEMLKEIQTHVNDSVQACENVIKGAPYSHMDLQGGAITLRLLLCHMARD